MIEILKAKVTTSKPVTSRPCDSMEADPERPACTINYRWGYIQGASWTLTLQAKSLWLWVQGLSELPGSPFAKGNSVKGGRKHFVLFGSFEAGRHLTGFGLDGCFLPPAQSWSSWGELGVCRPRAE